MSSKRNSYCEFTVQYWAWKNEVADYYGLCHYRRYLTFSDKRFPTNLLNVIAESFLNKKSIKKYDLLNEIKMKKIIKSYDAVVNEAADVRFIPTPQGIKQTVFEHWAAHDGVFLDKRVLLILLEKIKELFPEYYESAQSYLSGNMHRGYNCYVMKRVLFFQMCEFQFGILFALEKELERNTYINKLERTLGYLGEIMYGIFIYHLQHTKRYKIKEVQLVYFEQTAEAGNGFYHFWQETLIWLKLHFENVGYVLLPKASKRRDFIKKIYFSLVKR
ncbi:DUF4422 domain-containing protein [Dialister invisus]|uniref:DUF4422 domain-containing protein n=1 Tax=Dialister invisus TaxID=218538 RepID=UPI00265EB145|nr:DUF4422 domain-containing protein [Dialister invisus]